MNGASAAGETKNAADAVPLGARLRAVRPRDPRVALGMAVSYLMTDRVFARLPFGQWSRVLVGQVNRGHYLFVLDGEKVVGFVGWALADKQRAEAWLARNHDFGSDDSRRGEVALLNVWKSAGPAVNRFMVAALRPHFRGQSLIYAKRFYAGGPMRPVRRRINDTGLSRAPGNLRDGTGPREAR